VILRACLDCGRASPGARCRTCTAARKRVRNSNAATARAVVQSSPRCADCGSTTDLTSDHVVPLARGGSNAGLQRVLCRRHNSSRGGRLAGNDVRGRQ
jgi:5-methylcytosine-specific restriction endonuclease McrA